MNGERWARVGELFHRLVERPRAEQEAELAAIAADDPTLVAELRSLLTADRRADRLPESVELPGDDPLAAGTAVGAYRILAELARGGMGVVYRAERADGAFERQVAIKVARPDLLSPALGARFAEERRILGALDHPGIARLLDAGSTDDGRLFLVLDLVEGERLDDWARAQPLPARLALFLGICDAVAHAHQRLVLHRDLKPANVVVTADGQPKLLDFGIARLLDEGASPGAATRLGFRPLTPEYASPEQLNGEPLTTASDVYALGVVLFELLTGRRPHELPDPTSPEERARRIATDPLPRPSALLRRDATQLVPPRAVEGDLDAIVGRALAPEPAQRYPSVAALAADLRRHRDGLPVEARPPSFAERSRKFVRRHRAGVGVAAAFVLVLLGATGFSLRQAAIASRERTRAERRFADVRELARVFLFQLPDRIERLPGATGARELLVKTGLTYLDRLHAEAGGDRAFLAELAAGYERLGQVQGGFYAANVGETAAALATFDRAVELRARLAAAPDADAEARHRLAEARLLRATARFKNGRGEEALADATAATALLGAEGPGPWPAAASTVEDRLRARGVSLRGFLEGAGGDLARGTASLRAALGRFDALGAAAARDPRLRRERAQTLERLGTLRGQDPDGLPETDRLWTEMLAVDRELLAAAPFDAEWRRAVMTDLGRLSILRGVQGRFDEALVLSGEAVDLAARAVEEDRDNIEALRTLAQLRNRRSIDLTDTGRLDEAEQTARLGLRAVEAMLARDPANVTVETLVGEGHQALGQALLARAQRGTDAAKWRAARVELAAGLQIVERLIARGVLAKDLTEAREAEGLRKWIAECDRILAGQPATLGPDGSPLAGQQGG